MKKGFFTELEVNASIFSGKHNQAIARVMGMALLFVIGSMMIVIVMKANLQAVILDEQAIHLEAGVLNAVSPKP